MAAYYTPVESEWMKSSRLEREPGIKLVRCSDGLWRTEQEKAPFEDKVMQEIRRLR